MKAQRTSLPLWRLFVGIAGLVLSVWTPGCSQPPTPQEISGLWESDDKSYLLDLYPDGTYKYTAKKVEPTSLSDIGNVVALGAIPASGRWELDGFELSFVDTTEGVPVTFLLHVVSYDQDTLVLQSGDGYPTHFVKEEPGEIVDQ